MKGNFRLGLGLLSAATVGLAAWRMLELSGSGLLWGNWPLGLLLGLWGLILALFQRAGANVHLSECSFAGGLLGIAFAGYGAVWAPILGFTTLLYWIDRAAREGLRKRAVLWYAYHAMVLFNVIATWWVANTALAAGLVANFLNAFFQALVVLLIFLMRLHLPKIWLAGALVTWIGFEYLHFNWQIAWPWLCLGHTFGGAPALAQWFSVTGVFGGSLYVLLGAIMLYLTAIRQRRILIPRSADDMPIELPSLAGAVRLWLILLTPLAVSLLMWAYIGEVAGVKTARIAAVQPNFEPHYQKFEVPAFDQLARFRELSEQALADGAQLVVWPETSFDGVEESAIEREAWFEMWREVSVSALRQNAVQAGLLAGLSSYKLYPSDTGQKALRKQASGRGDTLYYTAHNTALAIDQGKPTSIYHKAKLVPGVEFLPYRKAMFIFEPLVDKLGGTTVGLGISDSAMVFRYATGIAAAPLICYESLYGDYVREFVQAGANVLVVPTNDGWWDDSPGHRQHFKLARLRAIETRRWVVQAANSGTSGFIDERGRAFAKTPYNAAAVVTEEVKLLSGQTFYVRYGDVIGRLCAGSAVLMLLTLLVRSFGIGKGGVKS